MKKIKFVFLISLIFSTIHYCQGSAGVDAKFEYRSLIDMPTAGILEKGFVGVTTDIMPNGVIIEKLEVGVFDNISFGISYGGSNIIGSGKINWYKFPGINFRARIINESNTFPAISVGFDSQGKGTYSDLSSRYEIKSPGFYAAVSKNFSFIGFLSLHGTVNYSLETNDGDNFTNISLGFEKTIGAKLSLIGEYNFALNDNNIASTFGKGNGYLNIGIKFGIGKGLTFEFDLRDLLNNKKLNPSTADRAIKIEYIKSI
ncbi:MAG: YjbH domain-containing protein [Bacteroidetes bacterium]|nr:YjbH domain-containing protein [Bacteroidota bacterium]